MEFGLTDLYCANLRLIIRVGCLNPNSDRKLFSRTSSTWVRSREVSSMSQKTTHVKLRCMECKAKFDSKYDAFDTSAITNVGQVLQNFIFCQRCGKRVSVVVFDIR